jgi:hypothetical protein
MKTFIGFALAGMLASAAAMPTYDKYGDKKEHHDEEVHKSDHKDHSLKSFPFEFSSTFHAKATPDTMYVSPAFS